MTPSYVKFNWDFIFRSELCALHIWQTHNNGNKVTFKSQINIEWLRLILIVCREDQAIWFQLTFLVCESDPFYEQLKL